jgi:hypothetical protein
MDAFMPCEVWSPTKSLYKLAEATTIKGTYFSAALPITGKRARFLLTIGMLQIDELKNVHSIVLWKGVSNAYDRSEEWTVVNGDEDEKSSGTMDSKITTRYQGL